MTTIRIGVVDDHQLFREGIVNMIEGWEGPYEVILQADNGVDLMKKLKNLENDPHILIMDSEMPLMNGAETTLRVKNEYPEIMVLALTMLDGRSDFMRLVKAGIDGFLNKNTSPDEVREALDRLIDSGHYFKGGQLKQVLQFLRQGDKVFKDVKPLTTKEMEFLYHATSELTYKAIATKMSVSEKTIDGYRARVFEKLDVNTRVGMVIRAVQEELVKL